MEKDQDRHIAERPSTDRLLTREVEVFHLSLHCLERFVTSVLIKESLTDSFHSVGSTRTHAEQPWDAKLDRCLIEKAIKTRFFPWLLKCAIRRLAVLKRSG